MKKQWKKLYTLALAAVLTASMVPMMALGAETTWDFGDRGMFDTAEQQGRWLNGNRPTSGKTDNAFVTDPLDESNTVVKVGKYNYLYASNNFPVGRYKITLRYMGIEDGKAPQVAVRSSSNFNGSGYLRYDVATGVRKANTWENYTMYFTTPETEMWLYLHLGDVTSGVGGYYDDFFVTMDTENSIEFVDTESFSAAAAVDSKTSAYRGTSIEKISAVEAGEAGHAITAVGHYIPTTQNEEKFNLISCVYQVNQKTNTKQLAQVQITPGTATGGVAATVSANVTVQAKTDEYTYEVKSFLWSELTDLQSLTEASTLSY